MIQKDFLFLYPARLTYNTGLEADIRPERETSLPYFGLTGNFGCGKSLVLSMFVELGAYGMDADAIVRRLTDQDEALRREIAYRIGPEALNPDGSLNRKRIAELIFSDEVKRRNLESLLHPYVFAESERQRDVVLRESAGRLVVFEAPLIYESGYDKGLDGVIVVICPLAKIFARLESRGYSRAEVLERLRAQLPQDEKLSRANFVIDNGDTIEATRKQVEKIYREILRLAPSP